MKLKVNNSELYKNEADKREIRVWCGMNEYGSLRVRCELACGLLTVLQRVELFPAPRH